MTWVILTSPRFCVKRIVISGLEGDLSSGLQRACETLKGTNLFLTRTKAIRAELQRLPRVKEVRIDRIPMGTLLVKVTPRKPVLRARTDRGFCLIDATGLTFDVVSSDPRGEDADPTCPTEACGLRAEALKVGQRIPEKKMQILTVCLEAVRKAGFGTASRIFIDKDDFVAVTLKDRTVVRLGQCRQLTEKLALAEEAYEVIRKKKQRAEYIDVRNPEYPTWKPLKHQPAKKED